MNFIITEQVGEKNIEEWFIKNVKEFALEKYGIKIEIVKTEEPTNK